MTTELSQAEIHTDGSGGRGPLLSVVNSIRVLEAFTVTEPTLGVNEIARRVDLHKSTISRILATLQAEDLVERDKVSGRFRLGVGVIGLAGPLLAHLDVRRIAYPALETLTETVEETTALCVWSGHESIVVEQVPSPRQVKHTTPLGTRFAKAASASVKVFLAKQRESEVTRLIRHEVVVAGPLSAEVVVDRLGQVRQAGYALNDGETDPEELSVAAPVQDHRDSCVATVLLSAPRSRMSAFLVDDCVQRVQQTAAQISARLGAGPREHPQDQRTRPAG